MEPLNGSEFSTFDGVIEMSMTQRFELEQQLRAIDACTNLEEIREVAKQLASALMSQKAATNWIMKQTLGKPPSMVAYENRIQSQE